jgi:hypothetical protein
VRKAIKKNPIKKFTFPNGSIMELQMTDDKGRLYSTAMGNFDLVYYREKRFDGKKTRTKKRS